MSTVITVAELPKPNITLAAFPPPDPLVKLMEDLLEELDLGPSLFEPYLSKQRHVTVIGLEAIRIGEDLYGFNFLNKRGQLRQVHIRRLLELIAAILKSRGQKPLFTIRVGGFRPATCTCPPSAFQTWDCRTSCAEFHSCDRSAYEGSFYGFPGGPVILTGWPVNGQDQPSSFCRCLYGFRRAAEGCGFLDSYHQSEQAPHWKDDDFYTRLGTFRKGVSQADVDAVVDRARRKLSRMEPLLFDVTANDLAIVKYKDTKFEEIIHALPLSQALDDPAKAEDLYADL